MSALSSAGAGKEASPATRIYVGLDVGYREHVGAAIPLSEFQQPRRPDAWRRARALHFASDAGGLAKLRRYLDGFSTEPSRFLVMQEPTGGYYGLSLQMYLIRRGYPILQVENRAVKEYREKVFGADTKTDEVDARLMARMGFLHDTIGEEFSIQAVGLSDPDEPALRVMVRDLLKLQKEITRRRNQLQQVIAVTFPELKSFFTGSTSSSAARALLTHYPTPRQIAAADPEELATFLRTAHAYKHAKRVDELQELARNTSGLDVLTNHLWRQSWILRQLVPLDESRAELLGQLEEIIARHPYTPIIESLPVKSHIWTATLIAVIGSRERFTRYSKLKRYLGWSPSTEQSGSSLDNSKLSKKGVRLARNVLGQMVSTLIAPTMRETAFRVYYERLLARRVSPWTAKGNLAGKLSRVLAGMLKTMTPYDEAEHRRQMGLPILPAKALAPVEADDEVVVTLTDEPESAEVTETAEEVKPTS